MGELPAADVLALLAAASLLAGWVDAIVGGGGLVQLPALLLALPSAAPLQLLATNKLASVCGTSVAAATFARRLRPDPMIALPLVLGCAVGSTGGALLGAHMSKGAFTPLVLFALVAVGLWTLRRPSADAVRGRRVGGRLGVAAATLTGLVIGCWDGMIGPGTGSFLIVALVGLFGLRLVQASGTAKLGNLTTNLAALAVFVPMGGVMWGTGLVMGVANVVGGYLGARSALRLGDGFVRVLLMVVVLAFIARIGGGLLGWW